MKQYLFPKKIVSVNNSKNYESLIVKKPLQIGVTELSVTDFSNNSYVLLDFSKEICGGIRILTFKAENTPVRIRFGESLTLTIKVR